MPGRGASGASSSPRCASWPGPRLVVLALRADFYDHALRYPGLAASLQDRQVVLGPMTAEQVRRAITEPARLARLDVEDGLVELLLRRPGPAGGTGHRDAAPTSRARCRCSPTPCSPPGSAAGAAPLTVADYLASGGIRDAIARTAEAAYDA